MIAPAPSMSSKAGRNVPLGQRSPQPMSTHVQRESTSTSTTTSAPGASASTPSSPYSKRTVSMPWS